MKKMYLAMLAIGFVSMPIYAQEDAAEKMVASKQQADMTYRQLMEILGKASSMIHA